MISGIDTAELQPVENEKNSAQRSLKVCEQFLSPIGQSRPSLMGEVAHSSRPFDHASSFFNPNVSWLFSADGPNSTHKKIMSWKLRLLQHLLGVSRIVQGQQQYLPRSNNEQESEEQIFREELAARNRYSIFASRSTATTNSLFRGCQHRG